MQEMPLKFNAYHFKSLSEVEPAVRPLKPRYFLVLLIVSTVQVNNMPVNSALQLASILENPVSTDVTRNAGGTP
jgi:hypothetical protein